MLRRTTINQGLSIPFGMVVRHGVPLVICLRTYYQPLVDKEVAGAVDHDRLRLVSDGDPEILAGLVRLFQIEARRHLDELRRATDAPGTQPFEDALHSLKGASGNIGATSLVRLTQSHLPTPPDFDVTQRRALASRVARELDRVIDRLQSFSPPP